jgi:endonuclease YncB( thermonuclease family)
MTLYSKAAAALALFILASPAAAQDCYQWPLAARLAYDGDTFYMVAPGLPDSLQPVAIRPTGYDAPEIRGKCQAEQNHAREARDWLRRRLSEAKTISLCNLSWDKYGGRVNADVWLDRQPLAAAAIEVNAGRPYTGGRRVAWCKE